MTFLTFIEYNYWFYKNLRCNIVESGVKYLNPSPNPKI